MCTVMWLVTWPRVNPTIPPLPYIHPARSIVSPHLPPITRNPFHWGRPWGRWCTTTCLMGCTSWYLTANSFPKRPVSVELSSQNMSTLSPSRACTNTNILAYQITPPLRQPAEETVAYSLPWRHLLSIPRGLFSLNTRTNRWISILLLARDGRVKYIMFVIFIAMFS